MSRIEIVCKCPAYTFPHRFSGGKCNAEMFVNCLWNLTYGGGTCTDCFHLTEGGEHCELQLGVDSCDLCPALQEYLRYNEQSFPRRS